MSSTRPRCPPCQKLGGGEDKTVPFFGKGLGWARRTRRDSRPDSSPGTSPSRNWEASHINSRGLTSRALRGEKASYACRKYLQFLKEETFSQAGFKKAAELGTEFLWLANGWEEACRVLRRTWIEDQGDHFQQLHGTFFEGLVDEGLLEKARSNAI